MEHENVGHFEKFNFWWYNQIQKKFMKIYPNGPEAVYELHRKGFSNDFQISGNDLLWVQENVSIRAGEFSILEYYKISGSKYDKNELFVFGIIALFHNIKGILITRKKSDTDCAPPVLIKKLNELKKSEQPLDHQVDLFKCLRDPKTNSIKRYKI